MIKQQLSGRNIHPMALEEEKRNIDILNVALGNIKLSPEEERTLIWLCSWETQTLKNIVSAFKKAENMRNS